MFKKNEFAVVNNLTFISRTNFMLSWVEHENKLRTLGPDHHSCLHCLQEYEQGLIRTFSDRLQEILENTEHINEWIAKCPDQTYRTFAFRIYVKTVFIVAYFIKGMVLTSDAPLGLTNCSSLEIEYTRIVTHPDITKKSDKPIRNEPKPLMGYDLNVTTADLLNQCRQEGPDQNIH